MLVSLSYITDRAVAMVVLLVALMFSAMGGSGFIPNPVDIAPRTPLSLCLVSVCLVSVCLRYTSILGTRDTSRPLFSRRFSAHVRFENDFRLWANFL